MIVALSASMGHRDNKFSGLPMAKARFPFCCTFPDFLLQQTLTAESQNKTTKKLSAFLFLEKFQCHLSLWLKPWILKQAPQQQN
jgi:hypothetical protein